MARPERNSVDYFPFFCEEGKKMYYIEETYGNDGFAVFVKLLRELARTEYHYLDLSKKTTLMFLSAKCKVQSETLIAIINDLVELDKFDKLLWDENQIIWCKDFVDSIQDAYSKRKNKCITYEGLLTLLVGLGVRKHGKSTSKGDENPQSKVKYSKEEENIIEETEEEPKQSKVFSEEIKDFSNKLSSYFPKSITSKLTKSSKENWLDTVRLLIEKDGYSKQDVLKAVKYGREDSFWSTNFLSLVKLRKKDNDGITYIDKFLLKSNAPKPQPKEEPKAYTGTVVIKKQVR